jgi:molybdopterin synthase sulfur carrier subunit
MAGQHKVHVNLYASLRQAVGQKSIDFNLPQPVSVRELILKILGEYPGLEAELVDDTGELHAHIHILVNGSDIRYLDGNLNKLLDNCDQVSIFPALGGGRKGIITAA